MELTPDKASYTLPYHPTFRREDSLFLFYQCRRDACQKPFIAIFRYVYDGNRSPYYMHELQKIIPNLPEEKHWPVEVNTISKKFAEIYNQALACELHGYDHASGPTYRKALEYIVKDYSITLNPDKEAEIKSKLLGNCINDYLENDALKECAKRAAWLGNDETHYVRKWEFKDISDLKTLIQLTVNHIQTALLTKKYLEEM